MSSTFSTVEKHVPAWKKLGLTLKNAKDEPAIVNVHVGQALSKNNKTKLLIKDRAEQTTISPPFANPAKKSKKSSSKPSKSTVTATQDATLLASAPRENSVSPLAPRKIPLQKPKSVSFAPQTKTEDADSTKDLYNSWLTTQLASDPSFDPSKTGSPALKSISPASVSDPTATVTPISNKDSIKKRKKSKSTLLSQPSKAPSNSAPAEASTLNKATLEYLQTYHANRAEWKFSKIRQTHLLRSLFPLSQKPSLILSSHLPALHAYLSGLQGQSARSRLRAQALAIRDEDEKWLNNDMEAVESRERRKEEYMREVERVKELLKGVEDEREDREKVASKNWWEKVQRRRMAEAVLWSVGERGEPGEEESRKEQLGKGQEITGNQVRNIGGCTGEKRPAGKNGKQKRKRKRRTTGVPDDASSSSSSSSSSGSSSSGDDDSDQEETSKGKATDDSDTSSSEESSSSGSESVDGGGSGSGGELDIGSSGSGSGSRSESDSDSGTNSGSG